MDKPVILVVEDNEIQRKVINLLAGEFGYNAVLAATCEEACDAFAVGGDIYRLVLMDFRLPDLDGLQCTKRLREIRRSTFQVPVVAMTGYVGVDDAARCIDAGFDDCLIKPFSSREFRAMVDKWVGKNHGRLLNIVEPRSGEQSG
jgi:CheY-like chemotaxis protein